MAGKSRDIDFASARIKELEAPGMWQDFYVEQQPFSKVSVYANDFHSWIADEWTVTEVGTSLQKLGDARNGVLQLVTGGTENDGNNLQLGGSGDSETVGECFLPAAGKNLWFEAYVALDDATESDFFVGLHVEDTAIIASLGANYIGFMKDDGDALLDLRHSSGSSVTSELGVATLANNTYVKLGFKVTGTSKIEYYVNDVLKLTSTSNIPTTEMKLSLAVLTGEGNAATLSVDYVVVAQDR